MKSKILNAIQEGIKQSFMIDGSELEDEDFVKSKIPHTKDTIPYEYRFVDLGLSVKWAEYNLGAYPGKNAKDWYGDYYAWGETDLKTNDQTYCNKTGNKGVLISKYDTVTQKLGNMFRMPTIDEFIELCDTSKITNDCVTDYNGISGLNGILFTSKVPGFKGNSIFIPATNGSLSKGNHCGGIWTSSLDTGNVDNVAAFYFYFYFYFNLDYCRIDPEYTNDICMQHSIRGVQCSL